MGQQGASRRWAITGRLLPVVGAAVALAWPFGQYALKVRDEALALNVVQQIRAAQAAFHASAPGGGYATSLESLTTSCPAAPALMSQAPLDGLTRAGYDVLLRARHAARTIGADCHGQPLADDFYLGVQPRSAATRGQRAFGATRQGVFVFFDGVAPVESDMGDRGLATPLEALATFKIP